MSRYYSTKQAKTRRDKIGFYTALSICLIAVCMAVYSTYNTVSKPKAKPVSVTATSAQDTERQVDRQITGMTVPVPTLGLTPVRDSTVPTETADPETLPSSDASKADEKPEKGRSDALETMLSAEVSLSMPTESGHVLRPFSRESVYYKTINAWKPHLGVDFDGELGDKVFAMLGGEVTLVTEDKMYGKTVEITVNNVTVGYCGMGEISVKKGDRVERGDKIGTVGAVPLEASDKNHIHVTVEVNKTYADPMSFIRNEE